jgi:hypothetical protein
MTLKLSRMGISPSRVVCLTMKIAAPTRFLLNRLTRLTKSTAMEMTAMNYSRSLPGIDGCVELVVDWRAI